MMYKISVIISTWRRPRILQEVLSSLSKQTLPSVHWEAIVVDSNSGDETPDVVSRFSQRKIMHLRLINAEINALTAKRNTGLLAAQGKFVVFLDDDCIPEPDHLEVFLSCAESTSGKRTAWCGGVKFPSNLVRESNYYRYRDGCHFSKARPASSALSFQNIVAMNLLVERELLIQDKLMFNERFIGYGFEDLQFGLDLESKQYQLLPCKADIVHQELGGDIEKFRVKFFHAGRDGMSVFKEISPNHVSRIGQTAWLEPAETNETFLHRSFRSLIHLVLDSRLPRLIATALLRVDKIPFLYSKLAYRLTLAGAYRDGVRARELGRVMNADRAKRNGWYS